ncbi:MAG: PQQ-binding-like beta-propeller repeat protein [Clostridium sp.]
MKRKLLLCSLLLLPMIIGTTLQGCGSSEKAPEAKTETKEVAWSYDSGAKINGSPVIYKDLVVFGNDKGTITAVDKKTQNKKWSVETGVMSNNRPIVDGNKLIFSSSAVCYAIDGDTGKKIWEFTGESKTTQSVKGYDYLSPSPSIYNDLVIVPSTGGTIFAVDKETGEKKWEVKPDSITDIRATPVIDGDIMVVGDVLGNGAVVDLKTQKTLWGKKVASDIIHGVSAHKGLVYFAGRDAMVHGVDAKTGSEKWYYKDGAGSWFTGDILVKDDKLFVPGSDNHRIATINAETGKPVSSYYGKANIFAKPSIAGDKIYFTDGNVYDEKIGGVYACDLEKADEPLWTVQIGVLAFTTPAVSDGYVYFGATDGKLYAIKE